MKIVLFVVSLNLMIVCIMFDCVLLYLEVLDVLEFVKKVEGYFVKVDMVWCSYVVMLYGDDEGLFVSCFDVVC